MKSVCLWLAAAFALAGCVSSKSEVPAEAGITLTPLVSDHAVLQRNAPIPVWGYAGPGARIAAELNGGTAETMANQDGYFILRLPALPAGGPYVLTLTDKASGRTLTVNDLYVGEVWLAGGQSNMAFPVARVTDVDTKSPEQTLRPEIRFFSVPLTTEPGRLRMATGGEWVAATPESVGPCSAVGYFFARKLYDKLGVPVGVINSHWGGTRAEGWISREGQMADPALRAKIEQNPSLNTLEWWKNYDSKYDPAWLLDAHPAVNDRLTRQSQDAVRPQLESDPGSPADWMTGELDGTWAPVKIPGNWSENGEAFNLNGVVWFRTAFTLPPEMAGKILELHLGAIDKTDETFVNGVKVGATGELFSEKVWSVPRVYRIPSGVAKPGTNILAVRNVSHVYAGGLTGPAEAMYVTDGQTRIDLAKTPWVAKVSQKIGKMDAVAGPASMYIPGILYQNMIAPLLPVEVRGVIWYQGESNAGQPESYAKLMELLIRDWRYHFEEPEMPFIQVQLAGFTDEKGIDLKSNWALIREAQQQAAEATGNGWVTAHDIGEAKDIHPQRKRLVGERLAACALDRVYRSGATGMGPVLAKADFGADKVVLCFENVSGGLKLRPGTGGLKGLYGSTDGKDFHAVKSEIAGDKVTVTEPNLIELRYGWSDNPREANLTNAHGSPAYCFRVKK